MKNYKNILIFAICYIAYTSIYIARLNFSIASPELINAEILSVSEVGMAGSIFSIVYAFSRLLNGILSDRLPPCVMIASGLILAGISNIAISFFPPFIGILLLWGANAYAQSMLWSSVLCILTAIYDSQKAKKMTSYIGTSVAAGNILGILLNTYIISKFGVAFAFIIPGGLTLIMSTFIILFTHKIRSEYQKADKHISMLSFFKNKEISLMIIPAALHGIMKDNISLWMAVYFVDKFSINLEQSAYFVLFIPVVGFIGRMAYPMFYRLCRENEHTVSIFSFILCAAFSIPMCFDGVSPILAAVSLSIIYAAVSMINTSVLAMYPIHFLSTGNVASVSGIMDFATYFGAGVSAFFYGIVIEAAGYLPMYLSWAVVSVISIIVVIIIIGLQNKNTHR